MKLSEIKAPKGASKRRKRVGRGRGSGLGKTAGRGQKGQTSRTGNMNFGGFEGGQMPLQRRLPKRGFRHDGKVYATVKVSDLEARFDAGASVDEAALREKGLIKKVQDGIKILGNGKLEKKLTVKVHKVTEGAKTKIEQAGGTIELLPEPRAAARKTDSSAQ
jgi:large subunit ribosomal protein L15